jgi:hypothetical protein
MAPRTIMGVELPSRPPPPNPPPAELGLRVESPQELRSDKATLELMKGRGFVLTFSSHFLVAVIVGVLGWVYAQQKAHMPDSVETDIKELQKEVSALRSDFEFSKATQKMSDANTEGKLNELLARTSKL